MPKDVHKSTTYNIKKIGIMEILKNSDLGNFGIFIC